MSFGGFGGFVGFFVNLGLGIATAPLSGKPDSEFERNRRLLLRFEEQAQEGIIPSRFFPPIGSTGGGEREESQALQAQQQAAQDAFDDERQRLALLTLPDLLPAPVAVPAPPPAAPVIPPSPAPAPVPVPDPGPAQEPPEGDGTEPLPPPPDPGLTLEELLRMAFSFGDIGQIFSDIGGVVQAGRDLGNIINPSTSTVPVPVQAGFAPAIIAGGRVLGGAAAGAGVMSLFGGGGNGVTALQQISQNSVKRVSRRQVITAAKVCGLDMAATTFRSDVRLICEVVSKGMPRRGRGISSRDLSRCRSTIRKMTSFKKQLTQLRAR